MPAVLTITYQQQAFPAVCAISYQQQAVPAVLAVSYQQVVPAVCAGSLLQGVSAAAAPLLDKISICAVGLPTLFQMVCFMRLCSLHVFDSFYTSVY